MFGFSVPTVIILVVIIGIVFFYKKNRKWLNGFIKTI